MAWRPQQNPPHTHEIKLTNKYGVDITDWTTSQQEAEKSADFVLVSGYTTGPVRITDQSGSLRGEKEPWPYVLITEVRDG